MNTEARATAVPDDHTTQRGATSRSIAATTSSGAPTSSIEAVDHVDVARPIVRSCSTSARRPPRSTPAVRTWATTSVGAGM